MRASAASWLGLRSISGISSSAGSVSLPLAPSTTVEVLRFPTGGSELRTFVRFCASSPCFEFIMDG